MTVPHVLQWAATRTCHIAMGGARYSKGRRGIATKESLQQQSQGKYLQDSRREVASLAMRALGGYYCKVYCVLVDGVYCKFVHSESLTRLRAIPSI